MYLATPEGLKSSYALETPSWLEPADLGPGDLDRVVKAVRSTHNYGSEAAKQVPTLKGNQNKFHAAPKIRSKYF